MSTLPLDLKRTYMFNFRTKLNVQANEASEHKNVIERFIPDFH